MASPTLADRRPTVDMSTWREQAKAANRIKFDDQMKAEYLSSLLVHGQLPLAARSVGVTPQTVRNHLKVDPEFAEFHTSVLEVHAATLVERLEREAVEGHEETIYSQKTGAVLGTKRVFETQIRLAILKRYDANYKDRSEVDIRQVVGVLVAPAAMTPADWIAQQQEANAARAEPTVDDPPRSIEHDPADSPAAG